MKKVRDKQQIKNIIHYLIKWTDWFSEYNFYKLINHLVDASKTVTDYKYRFKHKCKKISQINIDEVSDSENASCKQISRWDHIFYLIYNVLNETSKSCNFKVCSKISIIFWVNYIAFHSVSYFFYSQLQLTCWTVESCCAKTEKHFNENWCLTFWVDFSISISIMFNQYFDWFLIDFLISILIDLINVF